MPIINSIVNLANSKRLQQIDYFMSNPGEIQEGVFRKLVESAARTEWGRKHNYKDIQSIGQFQENVPLQQYDDMKEYIAMLREGKKDVLWPGEIKWFAKSSGTTSDKSKFIPISKDALENCHYRGGRDVLAIYMNRHPENGILQGKGITLGGSHKINNYSNNSLYGDLSAILIENLPFWVEFIKTPKKEIALLDNWEEKLEKLTNVTINEKVTNMAGVPSWTLVFLKYILQFTGKNHILEIWPQLELFFHGGVSFTPYVEQYKKIIPSGDMHYMETYNASEGFFAIQDDLGRKDMLLMLDYGVFYEFIPMEEFHSDKPRAIPLQDVETGKNYAIVISTNGGLWRYIIGDTVKFTSKNPYKLIITGRTKHFINAFGEEIIIDNAIKALEKACAKTSAEIKDYSAGPVFMADNQKGTHEWVIEFERKPGDLGRFIHELDTALQEVNSDYEAKRHNDITLGKPIVHAANEGTFYQWLKEKGKLGGQNKVPRLSNDRKIVEELIAINEKLSR